LLDKITVAYNGNVVKTYELKYNMASDYYNSYSELTRLLSSDRQQPAKFTVFSYQMPSERVYCPIALQHDPLLCNVQIENVLPAILMATERPIFFACPMHQKTLPGPGLKFISATAMITLQATCLQLQPST
jgi:hypothetical protein